MKKFLLLLFIFTGILSAQAQTDCTPDTTITQPGMYPPNLPDAKINMSYSEVIQFKFPSDTSFNGFKVPIDSVKLIQVDSLPSGFTFDCNKARCSYIGGENGCVDVKGNPTASMIGNYTIFITAEGYAHFGTTQIPPQKFTRSVELNVVSGSALYNTKRNIFPVFEVKQNQPNPFNVYTTIEFVSPATQKADFKVFDILGKQVFAKETMAAAGENIIKFERQGLKSGIYFYSLQIGDKLITKKMTIKE